MQWTWSSITSFLFVRHSRYWLNCWAIFLIEVQPEWFFLGWFTWPIPIKLDLRGYSAKFKVLINWCPFFFKTRWTTIPFSSYSNKQSSCTQKKKNNLVPKFQFYFTSWKQRMDCCAISGVHLVRVEIRGSSRNQIKGMQEARKLSFIT